MNKEQYKTYLRQRLYEGIGDIINAITNDTSSFRNGLRNIPGVATVEKKVAEAGYFPTGGFYDRNSNGKEDGAEIRQLKIRTQAYYQAMLQRQKEERDRPSSPAESARTLGQTLQRITGQGEKTITGHEGEIPNSDPLPSDTQRA